MRVLLKSLAWTVALAVAKGVAEHVLERRTKAWSDEKHKTKPVRGKRFSRKG